LSGLNHGDHGERRIYYFLFPFEVVVLLEGYTFTVQSIRFAEAVTPGPPVTTPVATANHPI
jgi:hypothetical protein